jgi:hypothetical protein
MAISPLVAIGDRVAHPVLEPLERWNFWNQRDYVEK